MNSACFRRAKETRALTFLNKSAFQSLQKTNSTSEKRKWKKTCLWARWANFRAENLTHRIVREAVGPASVRLPSLIAETTTSATVLTPRLVDCRKDMSLDRADCGAQSILSPKSGSQCVHQQKEGRIALRRLMGLEGAPLFRKSTLFQSHQNASISNPWSPRARRTVTITQRRALKTQSLLGQIRLTRRLSARKWILHRCVAIETTTPRVRICKTKAACFSKERTKKWGSRQFVAKHRH